MIISLVNSTEHLLQNADSLKINMTIFLDLNKSFDSVNHKIFIDKLMKYGVHGAELNGLHHI